MKSKVVTLMLAAVLALPAVAAPPSKRATIKAAAGVDTDKYINANKILMFINNEANFAYDAQQIFGKYDGLYFPYSSVADIENGANDRTVIYDAGMWMGAIDSASGDTLIAVAEYSSEYGPGPMEGGGPNSNPNDPAYRVYRLYSDSMGVGSNPNDTTNGDYQNWPIDQGAPYIVDTNGDTIPALIGDQMAWTVYNDADFANHSNDAGTTAPLGVEIQQSAFAFNREDPLGNVVFLKFKVMNKGARTLTGMYLSLWSDPDLGGASDDLVGCDTALSLGFCYNATNADNKYGSAPPCVGFDFFQGPLEYTGVASDTGRMWGQKYPGYVNQPMSSFNKYINGTDPSSKTHTYNYMQGKEREGADYQYLGQTLKFFNSGDPVAETGDLDSDPADRRFMLTTGPFTMRPGDSTEVLAAIIAGQGIDRKTSISAVKYYDKFAQTAYEVDFDLPQPPAPPNVHIVQDDEMVGLSWNNLSEVEHGDFPFEGYTVLQGEAQTGPWTRIPGANYDIRNGTGVIYDDVFSSEFGALVNQPVKLGSDPGVRRWFSTSQDFINGGALNNATEYFFRVEAYSYDPAKTPKTLTSATIVKVVPQRYIPEKTVPLVLDNIIPTTHVGISDGSVLPQIIDPDSLTGHTYKVYFSVDSVGSVYWTLHDSTAGVDKLTQEYNQAATPDFREDYTMVDGMLVHVYGPPPGYKGGEPGDPDEGWMVSGGARRWTQLSGDGNHMEGFRGAAGWATGPGAFFEGQGIGADRMRNLEFRLAATDSVGNFILTDSNVSYGYRYLRRAVDPPQKPEFAPYIINPTSGYAYQIFEQNVPLSVWDIDANPPRRLAVGFLENNVPYDSVFGGGTVDGRYWPPYYELFHNTDVAGPREWLFVFDTAYSTTPDPTMEVDILNASYLPLMLMASWCGRNDPYVEPILDSTMTPEDSAAAIAEAAEARLEAAFHPGDQFRMWANHINYLADTFTFVARAPSLVASGASALDNVKAVPNPFYLFSSFDRNVLSHRMQFTNLPAKCTISIFTLAGDRIVVISKDDPTTSLAEWDLLTENRVPLASGIYIYVVDAPGFGQKIGKMAIFTEQEQLDTY